MWHAVQAADLIGLRTTDAKDALRGLILPMSGHKGYVISFMMDVLAGVLTGSRFGSDIAGPYVPGELEALHAERCHHQGIRIVDRTWQSLARLGAETRVPLPATDDA